MTRMPALFPRRTAGAHVISERLSAMRARPGLGLLLSVFVVIGLGGCKVLPEAQSDPTRSFILSTKAGTAAVPVAADAPTVNLRAVELADYLRSRALVVRRGENEIEFREFAQWGEGLDLGIARILREELLARGAAVAVQLPGSRATAGKGAEVDLRIRVLASEGGVDGGIAFRAAWELTRGAGRPATRGDYRAENVRWQQKDEASLAAGISEAVAGLAAEIATALAKL